MNTEQLRKAIKDHVAFFNTHFTDNPHVQARAAEMEILLKEELSKLTDKEQKEPNQDAEDMAMTLLMNIENIGDVDFDNQEMILFVIQSALKAYANQKLKEQKEHINELIKITDLLINGKKITQDLWLKYEEQLKPKHLNQ